MIIIKQIDKFFETPNKKANKIIEKQLVTWKVSLISFLWGLFEGIFFFIVPDVIILYYALHNIKKGIISLFSSIAGTLVSAIIMFQLVAKYNMNNFLLKIPLINNNLITTTFHNMQEKGLTTMLAGPLSGIPYKIYSSQAALLETKMGEFFIYSVLSRIVRILPGLIITIIIALMFKERIKKQPTQFSIIYLLVWIIVYVIYIISMINYGQ